MERFRQRDFFEKRHDLLLKPSEAQGGLAAPVIQPPLAAMVVSIVIAIPVRLVFSRHRKAAFAASDHARIRKRLRLPRGMRPATQEALDTLEFVQRDERLVFPPECPAFPFEDAGVERVREDLVDRAQGERLTANPLALFGPKAPL